MASTGDVFLSVSAQAPEPSGKQRMSMMSPLLEEDDERDTEGVLSERGELIHPEFELDDDEKAVFMTETEGLQTKQNDDTSGFDMVDGVDDCDRLNSDGENFDEVFSDSNESVSDCESKDGDYETDLEFDEESECLPCFFQQSLHH